MSQGFEIKFDYRFDRNGFFDNPDRRETLEQAATVWENLIQEDLPDIPTGIEFSITNPIDGNLTDITLTESIDDLLIFVGAESSPFGGNSSLPHGHTCSCRLCCPPPPKQNAATPPQATTEVAPLAQASPTGSNAVGTIFSNRFDGSDFSPWVGSISFNDSPTFSDNSTAEWFFDTTPQPDEAIPGGSIDFFSTALHEIGHILGIGTASIFKQIGAGGNFDGENTLAVTDQQGIPLTSDLAHLSPSFTSEGEMTLMQPVISQRLFPTTAELALLADIGWEIEGFTPSGEIPPLATPEDDSIRGTILMDVIAGLEGDDTIRGETGDDFIVGDTGIDRLFGQQGNDYLRGDAGEDELSGGEGNDELWGGDDADLLIGEEGRDVLSGARGNDQLQGGANTDVLWGGEENDRLFGEEGNDWLDGGDGDDQLQSGFGNNWLVGGDGNDDLLGGKGDDYFVGGKGNDTFQGGNGRDTFIFHLGSGEDMINDFEIENESIEISAEYGLSVTQIFNSITKPFSNVSQINLSPQDNIQVFHQQTEGTPLTLDNLKIFPSPQQQVQTGSLQADILDATGGVNNFWFSGGGDDLINFSLFPETPNHHRLYGGNGDDILFATGENRLFGGNGNDVLNGLMGNGNNRLYGGEGDDRLLGGNNDRLFGGEGNDLLQAGNNNILLGGTGADQFILDVENTDIEIRDFTLNLDRIILINSTFDDLTFTQQENNTLLTTNQGTLATLSNISVNELNSTHFLSTNQL